MTTNPSKESVLVATELEVIKQSIISGKVTKVDGFSSEDLKKFDLNDLKNVLINPNHG